MKISVIIPVYNAERTVIQTIESVLKQNFSNIEIVLVNDGSKDNSQEVIDQYEKKYPDTVKGLQKENGGLSSARNYGVSYATGDYLMFLDAGDYIEENLFETLKKEMDNQIDLIKFKMKTVTEEGKEIQKMDGPIFDLCSGEEAFQKLYASDSYLEVACIYLYRKEFFIKNSFEYNETKYHDTYAGTFHEDFGLTPLVIIKAKSVVSTNVFGYNYVQDAGSITRNKDYQKNLDRAQDLLVHYDNMIETIKKYQITKETEEDLKSYYTNVILLKIRDLNKEDANSYIKEIKKRKMVRNIKIKNVKQLIKRILLTIHIKWYLKLR